MKVLIFFLIVGLIIVGLVYMVFDIRRAVKIEMKKPEIDTLPYYKADMVNVTLPEYYHITYPQYYSFKDILFRVDKPVDGVHKVTVEKGTK